MSPSFQTRPAQRVGTVVLASYPLVAHRSASRLIKMPRRVQ